MSELLCTQVYQLVQNFSVCIINFIHNEFIVIGALTETTDFQRRATNVCGTTYSGTIRLTVPPATQMFTSHPPEHVWAVHGNTLSVNVDIA